MRRLGFVSALLAAPLALLSCAHGPKPEPQQSQSRSDVAIDSFRQGHFEAAVEDSKKAIALDPKNADAHNILGMVALGRGLAYLDQLQVVSCLSGADADAVRRDATEQFRLAEQSFRHAVEAKDDFAMGWNNLSVAALNLQEYDAAIEAGHQALSNPGYRDAHLARANVGWAYFKKRDIPNAWKELHDASALRPDFCVGHYRLAEVYRERGDLERAAEEVALVVNKAECPIQEAFLLAGLINEKLKNRDHARGFFDKCISMAPRSCLAAECKRFADSLQ